MAESRFMRQIIGVIAFFCIWVSQAAANPVYWRSEWPKTNFIKYSVPLTDILSGGPPRGGIPPIDEPSFKPVANIEALGQKELVTEVSINSYARACPLRILMRHKIVNDELGGAPISATFCPLCKAAMVCDHRVGDKVLDFRNSGKLCNSDVVIWDRQAESGWQQYLGEAIVGEMTGTRLKALPTRIECWENLKKRFPRGGVLSPTGRFSTMETYCCNPYRVYDGPAGPYPHFLTVKMPRGVQAMLGVVSLNDKAKACSIALLCPGRRAGTPPPIPVIFPRAAMPGT